MRGKINNISRDKNSDLGAEAADVPIEVNEQLLKSCTKVQKEISKVVPKGSRAIFLLTVCLCCDKKSWILDLYLSNLLGLPGFFNTSLHAKQHFYFAAVFKKRAA